MKTESGNTWSDPGGRVGSLSCARAEGSSMLGAGLASPGAALNVGPGLEKAEYGEDNGV